MDARQSWSNNGHVSVDWSRVRTGDVVDYVDVKVKACPVRFGPPVWNVLVIAPNTENATNERLHDESIRTYWPKIYKWVPTRERLANGQTKMAKVPRPMFPGYLFVDRRRGLDDFRAPLRIKGVRDYLWRDAVDDQGRPSREPCVLPQGLYEALIEREGERSRKVDEDRFSTFKVGQQVRITDGPFKWFMAKVEKMDGRGRVDVLLEMFGRPTTTVVNAGQLERA